MAYIEDYLNGIKLDLESVDPKEGHELVKDSIYSQAKKIADIANHNKDFLIMMMDEFMTMMENEHDIVNIGECDTWHRISHNQLMNEFKLYLNYGLDAVNLFESEERGIRMTEEEAKKEIIDMANALQLIPNTPKGKAVLMALKALEQEPCEDAISRQAAIHCLEQLVTDMPQLKLYAQKVADAMSDLPSVYPQPKTGHWISVNTGKQIHLKDGRAVESVKCSECDEWLIASDEYDCNGNYCPNCGCRMIEPQESEG